MTTHNPHSTSTIHNVRLDRHFTVTSNRTPENPNLSFAAKGLLWYLISREPGWKVKTWHLAEIYTGDKKGNGIEAVRSMIDELKAAGFIVYRTGRDEKGHWTHRYDVFPIPIQQFEKDYPEDFKKMFPERVQTYSDNPSPVNADITPSNELPRNELTNCSVSVLCDSPPVGASSHGETPKVGHVIKQLCSGSSISLAREDLISAAARHRFDWTLEEIDAAWEILAKYEQPVRDWVKFCQGIIDNLRKVDKIKALKEQPCQKPTTQKKTSKPTNSESPKKTETKPCNNTNEPTSETDTKTPALANLLSEIRSRSWRPFSGSHPTS